MSTHDLIVRYIKHVGGKVLVKVRLNRKCGI